jgi:hypothetical protein
MEPDSQLDLRNETTWQRHVRTSSSAVSMAEVSLTVICSGSAPRDSSRRTACSGIQHQWSAMELLSRRAVVSF